MTREPVKNPDELADAALRERLREYQSSDFGDDGREFFFIPVEKAIAFVKAELSRARGGRAERHEPYAPDYQTLRRAERSLRSPGHYAGWLEPELRDAIANELDWLRSQLAAQAAELAQLRSDLATAQKISRDVIAAAGKGASLDVAAELRRMRSEGLVSVEVVDGVERWKLTEMPEVRR